MKTQIAFKYSRHVERKIKELIERFPDLFFYSQKYTLRPNYVFAEIIDGQIALAERDVIIDSMDINLLDTSECEPALLEMRKSIQEQERKKESQMPTAKETLEQMKDQPLEWVNPPQETTTVTFTVQAKDIMRTLERVKGKSEDSYKSLSRSIKKVGAGEMMHLIANFEQDKDFPVTFTHTYNHP